MSISVDDLPEAWNERMTNYLGLSPSEPSKGLLQDIHWSYGFIGYFPTYSIGSILAAQLFDLALNQDPAIHGELCQGRFDALRQWLTENVYAYGRKLTPPQLIETVTGGPFTIQPYMAYVRKKFGEIYGL